MGHAQFAKRRKPDILCAAISALTLGTINAMEELVGEEMEVISNPEDGFLKCDFKFVAQEKSVLLLNSMILSLQNLSKEYGEKYLQVKFEEV